MAAPSGLVQSAQIVEIENERTGTKLRAHMTEGGFDPIPIEAGTGDTIAVKFILDDGGSMAVRAAVPARRRPRVVRTQPARGRTDVALNSVVRAVFSEPVDPGSLTDSTVRLLQGNTAVRGTVRPTAGTPFEVEFVPSAELAPATEYRIAVSEGVRDLSGDPLEAPEPIGFRTFATGGTGTVTVMTATTGTYPGDYLVRLDGGPGIPLEANGTLTLSGVSSGGHWIRLDGVDENCTVAGGIGILRVFTLQDGGSASVDYVVDCPQVPTLLLNMVTTGEEIDPDGYQLELRDGWNELVHTQTVPANGSVRLPLRLGTIIVTFDGVSLNCSEPETAYLAVESAQFPEIRVNRTITCTRPFRAEGRLAYSSQEFVGTELTRGSIYVANGDGTGGVRITDGALLDMEPSWSPDGSRIIFARVVTPGGAADLYVVNSDGSNPVQLTDGAAASAPAWSPDGRRIAYVSQRNGFPQIDVIDLETGPGAPVRISPQDGSYLYPAWSPSGTEVAFVGSLPGRPDFGVYVARPDGSIVSRHEFLGGSGSGASDYASYRDPVWLPDGETLAVNRCVYGAWDYGCSAEEYVLIHPDGREVELIPQALPGGDLSPDGRTIAFESEDGIRFIRLDGQRSDVIIENGVEPDWAP